MLNPSIHGDLSAGAKWYHGREDDAAASVHPDTDDTEADPYAPGTPDYDTRTREQVIELPGGLLRVDYGTHA